jgi:hypothetical protein
MKFDREIYYEAVRTKLFDSAMTQQQVDGQQVILAVWEYNAGGTPMTDLRWLAYMLATVYHETAYRMWPVTEYGSQSYLQGKEYYPYVGRGFVQLTWRDNYDKASKALSLIDDRDLVAHPEVALDSLISARVMFRGMAEGWFTGRKLGDYFDEKTDDATNARQIINGNDDDTLIAGYHDVFQEALEDALIMTAKPTGDARPTLIIRMASDMPIRLQVEIDEDGEPIEII